MTNFKKTSWNDYQNNWWQTYLDIRPYTCANCKYADEYLCWWWRPYYDPTCMKGHSIHPDKHACRDFVMMNQDRR